MYTECSHLQDATSFPHRLSFASLAAKLDLCLSPSSYAAWLGHSRRWLLRGEEPEDNGDDSDDGDDEDDDSDYLSHPLTSDDVLPLQRLPQLREINIILPSQETIEDWGGDAIAVDRFIHVLKCRIKRGWLAENACLQTFRLVSGKLGSPVLCELSCLSPRKDPFC